MMRTHKRSARATAAWLLAPALAATAQGPNNLNPPGQINTSQFGVVAGYLDNPRAHIKYLLHVKERGMLAEVASQLDGLINSPPLASEAMMSAHFFDGSLKISARLPLAGAFSVAKVERVSIPRKMPNARLLACRPIASFTPRVGLRATCKARPRKSQPSSTRNPGSHPMRHVTSKIPPRIRKPVAVRPGRPRAKFRPVSAPFCLEWPLRSGNVPRWPKSKVL